MEEKLSQKSTKFVEDLKLYLFSSGKKDAEIDDIIHELEDHLYEAESKGKSIEQIIGSSPKNYMQSISEEMRTDYKGWAKYIPLLIVGPMSYTVFRDLISGTLSYGILTIIGSIIFSFLFFAGVMAAFRYTASRQVSKKKEFFLLLLPSMLSFFLISAILLIDLLLSKSCYSIWHHWKQSDWHSVPRTHHFLLRMGKDSHPSGHLDCPVPARISFVTDLFE